jgi:hypothetical protein
LLRRGTGCSDLEIMGRAGADRRPTRTASGLAIALLSAFSFGLAGPFAAALLAVGWSPLAVALGRLAGTASCSGYHSRSS